MLTEFLMVAILVYLQLTDHYAGVWSMCAAIISLIGTKSFTKVMLPKYDLWKERFMISKLNYNTSQSL
jgi:hypothetical protein